VTNTPLRISAEKLSCGKMIFLRRLEIT